MTEKPEVEKEPEAIDIEKLDIVALKVLAYDLLMRMGEIQQQVNAVQAEINSRKE